MKALIKSSFEPGVTLMEVEKPVPSKNEALIKVKYSSICGTDLHIYKSDAWARSRIKPPLITGHEMGGTVVEIGSRVSLVKVGDKVAVETHIVDWSCAECRQGKPHLCSSTRILGIDCNGSFAEFVTIPETNLIVNSPLVPDEFLPLEEPLGNSVHAATITQVSGKNVLVVGCGPLGLLLLSVLKCYGASRVIVSELNDYRIDLAKKLGADLVIKPYELNLVNAVKEATRGEGVDVSFDMSGHPLGISDALKALKPGGHMIFFGLPTSDIPLNIADDVIFKGITLHGVIGRQMFATWYEVLNLIENKKIDLFPIITHRFPLSEIDKAMEVMSQGKSGKIILNPEL
ncbi:MAG: L-threonine 3-dehydrogenase [candidate division WS2 bacterium]|nr:L-threonine 3-dehydrogenase [Candidatus Lithacetigena glycinireducens]